MKRFIVVIALVAGVFITFAGATAAETVGEPNGDEPEPTINLFGWYGDTVDWERGLLYAGLGIGGSLVTIFTIIGGAIPGSPAQARIDADAVRLDKLYDRMEHLIDDSPMQAPMVAALEASVNNLRDDLRGERWRQFFIASLLYALGGAFSASALALDMVQAVVVGAGWTAFLGAIGVKSDAMFRFTAKDAAIDKLSSRLGAFAKAQPAGATEAGSVDRLEAVMREATVAKSLTRR